MSNNINTLIPKNIIDFLGFQTSTIKLVIKDFVGFFLDVLSYTCIPVNDKIIVHACFHECWLLKINLIQNYFKIQLCFKLNCFHCEVSVYKLTHYVLNHRRSVTWKMTNLKKKKKLTCIICIFTYLFFSKTQCLLLAY